MRSRLQLDKTTIRNLQSLRASVPLGSPELRAVEGGTTPLIPFSVESAIHLTAWAGAIAFSIASIVLSKQSDCPNCKPKPQPQPEPAPAEPFEIPYGSQNPYVPCPRGG